MSKSGSSCLFARIGRELLAVAQALDSGRTTDPLPEIVGALLTEGHGTLGTATGEEIQRLFDSMELNVLRTPPLSEKELEADIAPEKKS